MKSENFDIRGSKCKAFWNTAWVQNANTSQCYVIRTFQGLLYTSEKTYCSLFWKIIAFVESFVQCSQWRTIGDIQQSVKWFATFRSNLALNFRNKAIEKFKQHNNDVTMLALLGFSLRSPPLWPG
jgi:hypothetical protein